MNSRPATGGYSPTRAALSRGAILFGLWVVLMRSGAPADVVFGLFAAGIATRVSFHLIPPEMGYVRYGALLTFMPHFLYESVLAGIDVARRAFDPRLPLRPGFITYPVSVPPGLARNTFATITSLLPGSVPADEVDGALVYHCLDITQPVVEQLSAEERTLAKALVSEQRDA